MAKKTKTRAWDVAEHLETKEDMAAYLEAALEDGDPALVAAALGDIARAKGMADIAREAAGRLSDGQARHRRDRLSGHERQRHRGPGGRAAFFPGLFRDGKALAKYFHAGDQGDCAGLPGGGMRPDRGGDGGDAVLLPGGGVRPGRFYRGGRR